MNRVLSCVILSAGTVLVIFGLNTLDSLGASLAQLFRGEAPGLAFWLIVGGLVLLACGVGGMIRPARVR